MKDFAKVFKSEKFGQILVVSRRDHNDVPCIKVTCEVPGIGLEMMGHAFFDTDRGLAARDEVFENFTLEYAESHAQQLFSLAGRLEE